MKAMHPTVPTSGILKRFAGRIVRLSVIERMLVRLLSWIPVDILTRDRYFRLFERKGFNVTPVRWDQPIPNTQELGEDLWSTRSEMVGIDLDVEGQLEFLAEIARGYRNEYDAFPDRQENGEAGFFFDQHSFRSTDPELLYCMIRKFKPKKLIEIGSGVSTLVAMVASQKNREAAGQGCRIVAIEPYPRDFLLGDHPDLTELIQARVEDVPMDRFLELERDDILFIDSSHVVRTGGDVVYEFLEILPRLKPGVIVHVHDVFLPADYPRSWVMDRHWFMSEQYLLQAFVAFNSRVEVLWAGSYMHLTHPDLLEAAFPAYRRNREWPGSFWMRMG